MTRSTVEGLSLYASRLFFPLTTPPRPLSFRRDLLYPRDHTRTN